jgi:glycosyltransferase involved in cell wall biosynthesis
MRVAVFAKLSVGPTTGGGFTYQQAVLDALADVREQTNHQLLATSYTAQPFPNWPPEAYVSLHASLPGRVLGRLKSEIEPRIRPQPAIGPRTRIDRVLDAHGVDLLWCLAPHAPTRGLPYVCTVWDLQHRRQPIFPEVSAGTVWRDREWLFSNEIQRAAAVVVGTAAGQAEVERFYGVLPERVWKIPHPTPAFALDPPPVPDDVLERFALRPGYVFYPAQFWSHKNHVGLLHALRLLQDDHGIQLDAVFVGSDHGNLEHVKSVTRRLGLEQRVHFLGFVSRPELVGLYRNALALAYISFFGPENLPPLEAFALGCPVIAADVPGAEEQLGDAAMLVPPTSEARIAEALLAICRDEALRSRLVRLGHEKAKTYAPRQYAEKMLALLDRLEPVIRTWR